MRARDEHRQRSLGSYRRMDQPNGACRTRRLIVHHEPMRRAILLDVRDQGPVVGLEQRRRRDRNLEPEEPKECDALYPRGAAASADRGGRWHEGFNRDYA
jgi:hypothetical protein